MIYKLTVFELFIFSIFFIVERVRPARKFPVVDQWLLYWSSIQLFALFWLALLFILWPYLPALWRPLADSSVEIQILLGYLAYSLVAYWYHRARHEIRPLWRFIHYMHHAPAHMEVMVAFFRHPLELILDSVVICLVGKVLGLDAEVVMGMLFIEAALEIYHHSNIRTPIWMLWLGYVIQLPEQHLIHHQRGVHRWNYATVTLWDALFGTVKIPIGWHGELGVKEWRHLRNILLFQY